MTTRINSILARLFASLVLVAMAAAAQAQQVIVPSLLAPYTGPETQPNAPGARSPGFRVQFNADALLNLAPNSDVELALPNGRKFTIVFELAKDNGGGIHSWIGYVKGFDKHYRIIVTTGPGGSYGVIQTPLGEFRLVPGAGHDWLIDMSVESALQPPPPDNQPDDSLPAPPPTKRATASPFLQPEIFTPIAGVNSLAISKSAPTPNYVVDLYVVYTTGFAQHLGANVMTRINFLVTRANTAYVDSEIAITLRLVGASMINYSDASADDAALYAVSPGCPTSCGAPFDAATFGTVEGLRTATGADLVSLLRDGQDFGGHGIAWVGSASPNAQYMYSVITGCMASCESVFIHELGHNMGARHDRYTAAWQSSGTGGFAAGGFGYAFCKSATYNCTPDLVNGLPGACAATQPQCAVPGDASNFRDIMAYFQSSTQEVYRFSNPRINCVSTAAGADGVPRPCGIATPDPLSADTVTVINANRLGVSTVKSQVIPDNSLPGSLQFAATGYSVAEATGSVTLNVSRVGGSFGAVSVQYATADGSALFGLDYVATSGNLNWADGDAANKSITVSVVNDGVNENGELFTVNLSNPAGTTGVFLGFPSSVPVTITSGTWPAGGTLPAGWLTPNGSAGAWTAATDSVFEGSTSLRSANVLAATQGTFVNSDLVTPALNFLAGTIGVAYKVSAYPSYGYFQVLVDGTLAFQDSDTTTAPAAPVAGWKTAAVPVTAGTHTITFRFANRLNFACASAVPAPPSGASCADRAWMDNLVLPLALATPTNSLASSLNPTSSGASVTFTATVGGGSGTPTGIAVFRDGLSVISGCATQPVSGGGIASCTTSALSVGAHNITAQYSGDVTYNALTSNTVVQTVNSAGGARKRFDMNGDLRDDIVWRNAATGQDWFWGLDASGLNIGAQGPILALPAPWAIQFIGDMNGDGKADILWRNMTTGQPWVWIMDGNNIINNGPLPTLADLNWQIVGLADFNNDGRADVMWRNTATGDNWLWMMDATGINIGSQGPVLTLPAPWTVRSLGDLNGDGNADILWYNTATGQPWVWTMSANNIVTNGPLPTLSDLNWQIVGTGDMNGDGKADIMWRNNATGANWLWMMDATGLNIGSQGPILTLGATWQVQGMGDLNGDGKADILWRDTGTGQPWVWTMNANNISTNGPLPTLSDLNWQIVKTK